MGSTVFRAFFEKEYVHMATDTDLSLRDAVIYSIYVRNHTEEGTFSAVIPDLDRIRNLGTDIIWLMPIHPIGEKG